MALVPLITHQARGTEQAVDARGVFGSESEDVAKRQVGLALRGVVGGIALPELIELLALSRVTDTLQELVIFDSKRCI